MPNNIPSLGYTLVISVLNLDNNKFVAHETIACKTLLEAEEKAIPYGAKNWFSPLGDLGENFPEACIRIAGETKEYWIAYITLS